MSKYSLTHLADGAVLSGLHANVGNERGALSLALAHIGETDERRLYVAAAHPSMVSYLVHELRFSEQAALKRLRAARTARKVPVIFTAVADGRLLLTSIVVLAAHIDPENADELLAAAEGKTAADLERWLRGRKSAEELPLVTAPPTEEYGESLSLRTVETTHISAETAAPADSAPSSEERYELCCQTSREAHEQMLYARALLSHAIPNGDLGKIVERAMKALVRELEKQKFGATDRPGKQRGSSDPRYIPFAVRREVWKRDGGQCAFRSDDGKRCPSHELLEFHHTTEVALGGTASVKDISLRCRTHNQYESERTFGKAFMENKREQGKAAAARARSTRQANYEVPSEEVEQTIWWLGIFGYSEEEVRWALNELGPQRFALPGTRGTRCMELLRARAGTEAPASA